MDNISVSVVMATYNDSATLEETIDSVLSQGFGDFELIVINDGCTNPATERILSQKEPQDARIKVIRKKNEGLTRALIDGCAMARGKYIARLDTGDIYLENRLQKQFDFMEAHPSVCLTSCGTRFVTTSGEFLYDILYTHPLAENKKSHQTRNASELRGITSHGSAMFCRQRYVQAGGYREQFYFAQDTDLWMRLSFVGEVAFLPEILYELRFSCHGVSGKYKREQSALSELVVKMRKCRENEENDEKLLEEAASINQRNFQGSFWKVQSRQRNGYYFVGSILLNNGNRASQHYLWQCLRTNPLHLRAGLKLLKAMWLPVT